MYYPRGIITSLVTSFNKKKKLDLEGIKENISFQKKAGIKSICILGGTGEAMSLTQEERQLVIKTTLDISEDLDIVVGALAGTIKDVIKDVEYAKLKGARACLVMPPPFVRPSERDIEHFYLEINSIGMPIILFNTPSRSGVNMSTELITRLAKIENVVGIKEASADILKLQNIRYLCKPPFSILQGEDSLFLASLSLGADGGLLAIAAIFPEVYIAIEKEFQNGNVKRAKDLHYMIKPIVEVLYEASHPYPLKTAMELRNLPVGPCRLPIYGLADSYKDRIHNLVYDMIQKIKSI